MSSSVDSSGTSGPRRRKKKADRKKLDPISADLTSGTTMSVLSPVPRTKVDELLERTLMSVSSLETINIPTQRLKLSVDEKQRSNHFRHGDSDDDDELSMHDSLYSRSPRNAQEYLQHLRRNKFASPRRAAATDQEYGLSSQRSLGADQSLSDMQSQHSEWSVNSNRLPTNRELIHEITLRAKRGQRPPAFVHDLDQLDPSLISWNSQITPKHRHPSKHTKATESDTINSQRSSSEAPLASLRSLHHQSSAPTVSNHFPNGGKTVDDESPGSLLKSSSEPAVNIIGCLHPIELVLAKADQRMRKQTHALQQKQIKCEERTKAIDDAIQWKFSRAERYAAAIARKQLQVQWLRIIQISRFFAMIGPRFRTSFQSELQFIRISRNTMIVHRFLLWWYRKHTFAKFQARYREAFAKIETTLKKAVRLARLNRAATRIRQFLVDHKGHHKVSFIVHRYIQAVRKGQKFVRTFLACKVAKIVAMEKIWTKLEVQYIRKKLAQKRARMRDLAAAKRSNEQMIGELDSKTFIEMKQQAQLWARIDGRMEEKVQLLKVTGVIVEESEEDIINRLLVPTAMRKQSLIIYLEKLRKEFYITQRNALRKQIELDATFKEHHAAQLLHGHNENLDRIINERYGKRILSLKYKPFYLFSLIDRRAIYDRVKECHHILETFKIKIDKFG